MTLRRALLLAAPFVAVAVATPGVAQAQNVEVSASVDTNEVELGDTLTFTLKATTTSQEALSEARLANPSGFTLVDSRTSPTQMVSIVNGRMSQSHGLSASWTLRADRLGTFTLGPASVTAAGAKRSAPLQRVTVVAPGQGKAKPRRGAGGGRSPFDPFAGGGSPLDPFKSLFPGIDDDAPDPVGGIGSDPKLALDAARAPTAFLHATVDKTRAVVGEQVTLTVYLYEDMHARQGRPADVHEATATDFVKRSLIQDETRAVDVGTGLVEGRPWSVKLVRKNALFPIKTGRLAISPMSLTLSNMRVGLRESETLNVDVTEPPVANRPSGYQIGDTGDFSLSSETSPRKIDQHGALGVTVELRGNGNMPAALPTPETNGIEWLEPQTRDSLGPVSNDRYGGTRTFSYVVRVHREGAVDLGEIRLPYYDPQTKKYEVARTSLGIVDVAKTSARDAGTETVDAVLPNLPAARTALEGKRHDASYLTERPVYWALLFGSPVACVSAIALGGLRRRARERRAAAGPSPQRIAKIRLGEATTASKADDGKAAMAAILRALEASVLASTGVNIRGTASGQAERELAEAGVAPKTAASIVAISAECQNARFAPEGVAIETARALWERATDVIQAAEGASSKDAEDEP